MSTSLDIRCGDFRQILMDLADASVDLILTDPPYARKFLPLYADLGAFAARVLKPGGSLLCYSGQSMLPEVFDALRPHLRYWWTLMLEHRHGGQWMPGKWVRIEWKPIVWFVRDPFVGKEYLSDRVRGSTPQKHEHEWAQGIEEVFSVIGGLTESGDLVCDPFAGSGSFGKAALHLGRRFVGAEIGKIPQKGPTA